ncbi:MAG: sulfotransferase family 2 domain-containing protein [Rhizobiales bacterium]|nr:sulfotransferase family 2 domain-containing protein [Hyphomicrobiales bacterium]
MPIFRVQDKNVLYIHVPKTGGTSVEAVMGHLAPLGMHNKGKYLVRPARWCPLARSVPFQHFHRAWLEEIFAPGFIDYAFMMVRDPVERMKSEYRHARARNRTIARLSFDNWLALSLNLARVSPHYSNNHFMPQASFECLNADVFRFEDGLMKALRRVSDRIGIGCPNDIPHERRGGDMDISVSRRSRELVRSFFAPDYERYGYA